MSSPPPFYHCNCIAIVVITINFAIISSSLRKINGNRSSSLLSSSFSSLLLLLSWRSVATALSQLNQVLPQLGLHIARSDIAYCQVRSHLLSHQPLLLRYPVSGVWWCSLASSSNSLLVSHLRAHSSWILSRQHQATLCRRFSQSTCRRG